MALTLTLLTVMAAPARADELEPWRREWKVGDRIELHINGDMWQQCVVVENAPDSVMRGQCEEYVQPSPGTYRRAGGRYILGQGDVRRPPAKHANPSPAPTTRADPPPRTAPTRPPATAPGFAVGDRVEIEASHHWVPCVVVENQPPAVMRVRCEAYPALSRDAGVYTVDRDNPQAVRKATGHVGPIATPPPPNPKKDAQGPAGLKVGEYACYGSGGRAMVGLGFVVKPGNRFTDLDGGNAGTFTLTDGTVTFHGGHLDGKKGRMLGSTNFALGSQAECEPF